MGATINRESVIKGACLALAHAAQMLDDSSLLYQFRRFSSSFCLAVSAREELGRLHLLWGELRDLNSNGVKEAKVLVDKLSSHINKLEAGITALPIPLSESDRDAWINAIQRNDVEEAERIFYPTPVVLAQWRNQHATSLHRMRLAAQYVDLDRTTGQWTTPADLDPQEARNLINVVSTEITNLLLAIRNNPDLRDGVISNHVELPWPNPYMQLIQERLVAGDA